MTSKKNRVPHCPVCGGTSFHEERTKFDPVTDLVRGWCEDCDARGSKFVPRPVGMGMMTV